MALTAKSTRSRDDSKSALMKPPPPASKRAKKTKKTVADPRPDTPTTVNVDTPVVVDNRAEYKALAEADETQNAIRWKTVQCFVTEKLFKRVSRVSYTGR